MNPERLMELVRLGDREVEGLDRDAARLHSVLEQLRDTLEAKRRILVAQLEAVQEILADTISVLEPELTADEAAERARVSTAEGGR